MNRNSFSVLMCAVVLVLIQSTEAFSNDKRRLMIRIIESSTFNRDPATIGELAPLEVILPNGNRESVKERKQEFEVDRTAIIDDAFSFSILVRRGNKAAAPCEFQVKEATKFDRRLVCRTQTRLQAGFISLFSIPVDEYVEARVYSK